MGTRTKSSLLTRITDSILWVSLSGLLLLFPIVAYLLQPTADLGQQYIKESVHGQKELLNAMRREVALLSTGYRDNPREELLDLLSQYQISLNETDNELKKINRDISDVRERWKDYLAQQDDFRDLILEISSLTASYGVLVSQSEAVFNAADLQLIELNLGKPKLSEYELLLSGILFHNLRYVALPNATGAYALKDYLEKVTREMEDATPAIRDIFNTVLTHHVRLKGVVEDIQDASTLLMTLSVYFELESFEQAYEGWLDADQKQRNDSRWAMLATISLLLIIVAIVLWRLRSFRQKLEVSNIRLRSFKDALDEHAIVSITDPKGRITYVNQQFIDISGYQPYELLGKNHRIINSGVHPKGFFGDLWASVMDRNVWHGEVCNRAKNGRLYWVHATVVPIYDEHDQLASIISVRTDITQQKMIEKELSAEKERAEAANRAKSHFLANMSHEIRTPMNAVIGMSHLAAQSCEDDKVNGYISKIQYSAQNLLSIINDILDFSKIEAGKLEIESIPFRLDNVLNNLADIAGVKAEDKSLPLIFSVQDGIPQYLEGDPLRLGQVLLNLVNNAIKFTDQGEIKVSVNLLHQTDQSAELRFSVKDSGIGLTEDAQQRLFKAFSQADASTTRKYGGTGLGLAICKQLVELMGGEISVYSEPGEGSEFFFTINVCIHEMPEEESPDLEAIRVLVIDDEKVAVDSTTELLSSIGIEAVGETSSPDGLNRLVNAELVGEAQFDVVLIDWQMPIMDGFQVAQSIRNNSSMSKQPVIILITGHGGEDLQTRINPELIDAVLLKPVSGSHLADTLQECLINQRRSGKASKVRHMFREGDEIRALLGARVLIAEDNLINQEVISGLLEPYGLELTLVDNGRDAVNAVQQSQFDLIMMDIQMPQLDGLQATAQILEMNLPKTPPIIAMTAHAMKEDIDQCRAKGMNDHISKPIDPDRLKAVLLQWIEPRVITGEPTPESVGQSDQSIPCMIDGINLELALRSVAGNKKLLRRLIRQFRDDYESGILPARQYMSGGEWKELTRWLHTLKGTSSTLGMVEISEQVKIIEVMLANNKLPGDHDLGPLELALDNILTAVGRCDFQDKQLTVPENPVSDQAFREALLPMQATYDPETIRQKLNEIREMLEEGDAEVLDKVPELMEMVQEDGAMVEKGMTLMELVENFEFDQASDLLEQFEI